MSCETCRYHDYDAVDDDKVGLCKRYAPRPGYNDPKVRMTNPFIVPFWPITAVDDWCGEWEKYVEQDPAREI